MKKSVSKYIMLGYAISDEQFEIMSKLDNFPQIQTHKYIWSFIRSLNYCSDISVKYISTSPISDFPHNKKVLIFGTSYEVELLGKKIKIKEIPFINFSVLKILTRFLSFFGFSIFEMLRSKKEGVIVYSVSVPLLLAGYIVSRIFKTKLIGIWTDPPSVPNQRDSFLKRNLRTLEYKLSLTLMKKFDKIFPVTNQLAADFCPTASFLVIDGFTSDSFQYSTVSNMNSDYSGQLTFLYTGTLDKKYGIEQMSLAFKKLPFQHIKLVIYGAGDYMEELIQITSNDPRIEYRGFASHEIILSEQKKANFLINVRSPYDDYVKYSFPSKTLEYLSSGVPVISTILPGFSEEYNNALIGIEDNSLDVLYDRLFSLINSLPLEYLTSVVNHGAKLAASRTSKNRSKLIADFLLKEI